MQRITSRYFNISSRNIFLDKNLPFLKEEFVGYLDLRKSAQARRKLLGSIFPAKLIFRDGNYRTSALNPALALILQKNKDLQNEKAEDIAISENVSGDVARTGILSGCARRRASCP